MFAAIKGFANEVVKEMKKVSWPSREQLKESSYVVVITTLIFTAFTFLVDQVMTKVVSMLF